MSFFYTYFSYCLIFFIGIFIGSFLNVLADRIPRNEKITGRSHCEFCNKTLVWKDLIPIFSFVFLKGKCRYCKEKLSLLYPISEIITGSLFVIVSFYLSINIYQITFFETLELIFYLFLASSLIIIFLSDIKYKIIPDRILFPLIFITFIYVFVINNSFFIIHVFSGLGSFIFFLLIYLLTRGRGMGFGDVKFAFFMGLILGFPAVIYGLYVAFLTGGIFGLILSLWKKKKIKSEIAFGPFLILGTLVSLLFQEEIRAIIQKVLL